MTEEHIAAIRARLRFNSIEEFIQGYARYISPGGIFIPMAEHKLKPLGTIVRFQFLLHDSSTALLGEGVVTQLHPSNPEAPQAPVGILVKFTKLSQSSKQIVERINALKGSSRSGPKGGFAQTSYGLPSHDPESFDVSSVDRPAGLEEQTAEADEQHARSLLASTSNSGAAASIHDAATPLPAPIAQTLTQASPPAPPAPPATPPAPVADPLAYQAYQTPQEQDDPHDPRDPRDPFDDDLDAALGGALSDAFSPESLDSVLSQSSPGASLDPGPSRPLGLGLGLGLGQDQAPSAPYPNLDMPEHSAAAPSSNALLADEDPFADSFDLDLDDGLLERSLDAISFGAATPDENRSSSSGFTHEATTRNRQPHLGSLGAEMSAPRIAQTEGGLQVLAYHSEANLEEEAQGLAALSLVDEDDAEIDEAFDNIFGGAEGLAAHSAPSLVLPSSSPQASSPAPPPPAAGPAGPAPSAELENLLGSLGDEQTPEELGTLNLGFDAEPASADEDEDGAGLDDLLAMARRDIEEHRAKEAEGHTSKDLLEQLLGDDVSLPPPPSAEQSEFLALPPPRLQSQEDEDPETPEPEPEPEEKPQEKKGGFFSSLFGRKK